MSYRLGDDEGDEELFGAASSVSGGDSESDDDDDGDHFPGGGGGGAGGAGAGGEGPCDHQDRRRRAFVPQPLRRMNSDSIYDMTSIMSQLPARKGLSRYYEGKSQSFACMSEVRCLEDLRKKDNSAYKHKKKIKSCSSYAALGRMVPKKTAAAASSSCADLGLVAAAANGFIRTPPIQNGYHQ